MRLQWCFAVAVLSVIGLSSIFGEDDPCTTSMELHSIEGRSPTSTVDIPCDAYISKGWYKTPRYDMITFNPGINKCGSIFPIYLKESLTDNLDIQDMDACMIGPGDDCVQTIPIRVKKCEEDRAYYLTPTKSCQSTYCFNISREYTDPAPTWIPKTISVSTEIDFEKQPPEYFFRCDFDMATEPLLYKVYWYVNSKKIRDTGFMHKDKIPTKGYLLERHLLTKHYRLNIMIACAVVAAKSHKGEPGTLQKSKDFFAGIKVLTNSVKIKEGGSANAVIIPTIPLPCPYYRPTCEYQIWMYEWSQKEYQCKKQVNIGSSNRCGTIINGKYKDDTNKEWNKSVTMEIRHRSSNKFPEKSHYTLQLRVAETQFNNLLKNTLIDDISVEVSVEGPEVFQQKVCYGLVDPHMRTFDGNQFEMHLSGGFLMYRNKKYSTMVQVKTTKCSTSSNVRCICGIAIRAGRDVFMIYMCPDLRTKIDQFIRCHDGLLTATSKGTSEYRIHLPSGTQVKVQVQKYNKDDFINVYIYPTSLDLHETEGLCGVFDNKHSNDFKLRTGTYTNEYTENFHSETQYGTFVDDFSNSWSLLEIENLFPHKGVEKNYDSLQPMNNKIQFCYCPYNDYELAEPGATTVDPNGLHGVAHCDYREYAECEDKRQVTLPCRYHKDKKRSIRKINRDLDIIHKIDKRDAVKTYTESEAYDACNKVFEKAELIQKCSGANLIDNSSLSLCVMDYMLTGDERWIRSHIESARSQCMHEIEYNNTLKEDQPDLVSEITNLDCQNNCSDQGLCVNGTCKCNDGYFDTDCSVNIADPPPIHGTSHGELCDKSKEDCQEIDLYGEAFLHEYPPALKIQKYTITSTNEKKLSNSFSKRCIWRGQFEVTCEFYEKRTKRNTKTENTFVTQYTYSISNDGKHYSDEMILHVMDSSCQEIKNNSNGITFYLKDKHCFIDGICYMDDDKDPTSSCNVCSSGTDKYTWTVSNEGDCVSKTSVDNKSGTISLIIGLTVGGSILVVLMVVVGFLIVKYKKPAAKLENKKNYEREPSFCRDFEIFQANTDVKKWVDATGVQLAE